MKQHKNNTKKGEDSSIIKKNNKRKKRKKKKNKSKRNKNLNIKNSHNIYNIITIK